MRARTIAGAGTLIDVVGLADLDLLQPGGAQRVLELLVGEARVMQPVH